MDRFLKFVSAIKPSTGIQVMVATELIAARSLLSFGKPEGASSFITSAAILTAWSIFLAISENSEPPTPCPP